MTTKTLDAKISTAEIKLIESKHGSARAAIRKKQTELGCNSEIARRWLLIDLMSDVLAFSMKLDIPQGPDADDQNSQREVE